MTVLDDTIQVYGEGPAFYRRVAVNFAKVCDTVTNDIFAPASQRRRPPALAVEEAPAKVFIYCNSNRQDNTALQPITPFLSVSIPNIVSDDTKARTSSGKMKDVKSAIAQIRRRLMLSRIKGINVQPQNKMFFPLGFCAEALSFAA